MVQVITLHKYKSKFWKVSLYGLHRNLQHWGDPDTFRPERFLLDGKVIQVVVWLVKSIFGGTLSRILGYFHFPLASGAAWGSQWPSKAKLEFCEKLSLNMQGHCVPDVFTGSSAIHLGTIFSTPASFFGKCWRTYNWTSGVLGKTQTSSVKSKSLFYYEQEI